MHQVYLPSVPTFGVSTLCAVFAPSFLLRSILKSQAASKLHPHAIGVEAPINSNSTYICCDSSSFVLFGGNAITGDHC